MSDRTLIYSIKAIDDGASSKFQEVALNAQKSAAQASKVNPTVAARVDRNFEQAKFQQFLSEERETKTARERAAAKASSAAKEARDKAEREKEHGGTLHQLNQQFGRRSEFGHLLHALEGGGAVFALSQVTRIMAEVTGKAAELKKEFEEGKKSGGEVADELIRSVPILGHIYEAGRNIRELFTDEAAAAARIREEAERTEEVVKLRLSAVKAEKQAYTELAEEIAKAKRASGLIGLPSAQKEISGADAAGQDRIASINKEVAEKEAKIKEKLEEAKGKLRGGRVAVPDAELHGLAYLATHPGADASNSREVKEARLRNQGVDQQLAATGKQEKSAIKRIESEKRQLIAEELEKTSKEKTELNIEATHKYYEHRAAVEREEETKLAEVRAQVGRELARQAGNLPEFERGQIEENLSRSIKEIYRKRDEAIYELTEGGKTRADPAALAAENKHADELAEAERQKAGQGRDEINRQAGLKSQEVESQLRRGRIDSINEELNAGIRVNEQEKARLEIQEQYARRRQELNDLLREAHETQRGDIQDQLAGLDAEEKRVQVERQRRIEIEEQVRSQQQQGKIEDQGIRLLREQIGPNNRAGNLLLEKLQKAREFQNQQQELQATLNDPNASAQQKAQAQALLSQLPKIAEQAIRRAGQHIYTPEELAAGATTHAEQLNGSNHFRGFANRARADAFLSGVRDQGQKGIQDLRSDINRNAKNADSLTKALIQAIEKLANQKIQIHG